MRQDGEITDDTREMVEILNKNFQEIFVMEDYGPLPFFEQRTNEKIYMVPDDIKFEKFLDIKKLQNKKIVGY